MRAKPSADIALLNVDRLLSSNTENDALLTWLRAYVDWVLSKPLPENKIEREILEHNLEFAFQEIEGVVK